MQHIQHKHRKIKLKIKLNMKILAPSSGIAKISKIFEIRQLINPPQVLPLLPPEPSPPPDDIIPS